MTSLLRRISEFNDISLSTLKVNARILRDLDLISFGNSSHFQTAKITDFGKFILEKIRGEENER